MQKKNLKSNLEIKNIKFLRDTFIDTLFKRAQKDKKIILICNDQGAIALDNYRARLPNQFLNAGISEQNIISTAAGLAKEGYKCFVYSISSFILTRAYEQIKIDLCAAKTPVKIYGVGCGYSYAIDGPTHHSTEDTAILNVLPNIEIFSPSDNASVEKILNYHVNSASPSYVRIDRESPGRDFKKSINLKQGFRVLLDNNKNCIISTGNFLYKLYEMRDFFRKANVGIIDLFKHKPINKSFINKIAKCKNIFSIEEHNQNGGIGDIISSIITSKKLKINLYKMSLKDNSTFDYGSRNYLLLKNNLDKDQILKFIKYNLGNK